MKHEVEITAGAIRHIHPSMAFQGIEEGKVVVVAVGTLESLDSYPEPISVAVSDCEDYLDDDLSPDEIRKSLWVVYIEDRGLNCLLIDDFIDHTTPL